MKCKIFYQQWIETQYEDTTDFEKIIRFLYFRKSNGKTLAWRLTAR